MKAKTAMVGAVVVSGLVTLVFFSRPDATERPRPGARDATETVPPTRIGSLSKERAEEIEVDGAEKPAAAIDEPRTTSVFGTVRKEARRQDRQDDPNDVEQARTRRQAVSGARVFLYGMKMANNGSAYVRSVLATTADEHGSFRFSDVSEPIVRLASFRGPDVSHIHEAELDLIHVETDVENGPYDLVLQTGLVVTGVVRDRDSGEPLAGAQVRAGRPRSSRHGNADDRETVADREGLYRLEGLPAGRVDVVAEAEGYATAISVVTMVEDGPTYLDLDLETAGECLVHVTTEDGRPLADVEVRKYRTHPDGWSFVDERRRTDPDGYVLYTGLSRSEHSVFAVEHEGYERYRREFKPSLDGDTMILELAIVLRRLPEKETRVFSGRVTDPRGAPIPEARVYWSKSYAPTDTDNAAIADRHGEFYLAFETRDETFYETVLSAVAKGRAPVSKEKLRPGSESEPRRVNFVLQPGHWLGGQIVSADGTPLPGVRIRVKPTGGEIHATIYSHAPVVAGQATWIQSDADGRFSYEDLPGPEVYLDLVKKGFSSVANVPAPVDQDIRVVLEGLETFRGRVLDAESGEPIPEFNVRTTLNAGSEESGLFFSSDEGRFEIGEVSVHQEFDVLVSAVGYGAARARGMGPTSPPEENVFSLSSRTFGGVVIDAVTERPLPGVLVILRTGPIDHWDAVERRPPRLGELSTVRTEVDGRFEFLEGSAPGWLYFQKAGYAWSVLRRDGHAGTTHWIEARLDPQAVIAGEWRLERACVLRLDVAGPGRGLRLVRSGPFRFENLPAGKATLLVDAELKDEQELGWVYPLELMPDMETRVAVGPDRDGIGFSGSIVDSVGRPLEQIHIRLKPSFRATYASVGSTGSDGHFEFRGLRPGRYTLEYGARFPTPHTGTVDTIELTATTARDLVAVETKNEPSPK